MKTHARIQDGLVVELLKTNRDIAGMFHPALVWVDVSSHPDVSEGWHFDGKTFASPTPPQSPAPAPTIAELQAQLASISAQLAALTGKS